MSLTYSIAQKGSVRVSMTLPPVTLHSFFITWVFFGHRSGPTKSRENRPIEFSVSTFADFVEKGLKRERSLIGWCLIPIFFQLSCHTYPFKNGFFYTNYIHIQTLLLPTASEGWGKVMFSHLSVHPSVCLYTPPPELARRRSVCLLHSRRRTFLLHVF